MKKIIMTLMAVAMISTAMAQDNNGQQQRRPRMNSAEMVEQRTKQMTEKYLLSTEQAQKVKELNEKYFAQMGPRGKRGESGENAQKEKRQRPSTDGQTGATPQKSADKGQRPEPPKDGQRGPRGPRHMDMTKYNEELKTILSADQYKAYEADMAKMKEEFEKRRQNNQ